MEPERIRSTVPPWTKYLRHPNPDSPNRLIALNDDAVAEDVIELVSGVIQDLSLACYRQVSICTRRKSGSIMTRTGEGES